MCKVKKKEKRIFETKLRLKMYHIQRKKTVGILTILPVNSDLAPLVIKNQKLASPPLTPLVRKIRNRLTPPSPLSEKIRNWLTLPPSRWLTYYVNDPLSAEIRRCSLQYEPEGPLKEILRCQGLLGKLSQR